MLKNRNELIYNGHLCCVLSCSCKYFNVFLLKDPNVRLSTHNSFRNSFQSFAPVNLKVDWPIVDLTLGRGISCLSPKVLPWHLDLKVI